MKHKILIILIILQLLAVPLFSSAQYFQRLYDIDSSQDWGWDIFVQPNGNYFIKEAALIAYIDHDRWELVNMQISANGDTILSEHIVRNDSASLYDGANGGAILLPGGGYLSPLSINTFYSGYNVSSAGLIKYNAVGDTVFLRTYTDISTYFDGMICCAIMPDGGYIAGGERSLNTSSNYKGIIARTDSMGDTMWTRTYQFDTTQLVQINNIIPLAEGRIVVGATSSHIKDTGADEYYYNGAWFMVLDSMGNIIIDTVYSIGFMSGGNIFPDMNGGYIIWGAFDSLYMSNPNDIESFPNFIAHVDSNFRITWITDFPYTNIDGHRTAWMMHQLRDSNYIILGDQIVTSAAGSYGWAAKVGRNGTILWNHYYLSDSANTGALRDMAERPDGSLIFTGTTMNDTLPAWHTTEDVWLVSTDSNGCENVSCTPRYTKTTSPGLPKGEVTVYPNPTSGEFTVQAQSAGMLEVYNIQGQVVAEYKVNGGANSFNMPAGLSAGVYVCKYVAEGGRLPVVVRLLYEP